MGLTQLFLFLSESKATRRFFLIRWRQIIALQPHPGKARPCFLMEEEVAARRSLARSLGGCAPENPEQAWARSGGAPRSQIQTLWLQGAFQMLARPRS